jgi:hypothetical protein
MYSAMNKAGTMLSAIVGWSLAGSLAGCGVLFDAPSQETPKLVSGIVVKSCQGQCGETAESSSATNHGGAILTMLVSPSLADASQIAVRSYSDGSLFLNGEAHGRIKAGVDVVLGLLPGKYDVRILADGLPPVSASFVINHRERVELSLKRQ